MSAAPRWESACMATHVTPWPRTKLRRRRIAAREVHRAASDEASPGGTRGSSPLTSGAVASVLHAVSMHCIISLSPLYLL